MVTVGEDGWSWEVWSSFLLGSLGWPKLGLESLEGDVFDGLCFCAIAAYVIFSVNWNDS